MRGSGSVWGGVGCRIAATTAVGVLSAGCLLAGAGSATASGVLYAAVRARGTGDCWGWADACTLSVALAEVAAGGVVELVTPSGTAHYKGNWSIATTGTSARRPVTIQAWPGLSSAPVLDGNGGEPAGCATASCAGPVLTVPARTYVRVTAITVTGADDAFGEGGGLLVSGSVIVTDCTFTGDQAGEGGAIDSGDGRHHFGSVTVTDSVFIGNGAGSGAAIDSGGDGGTGSLTVADSTFTGNSTAGAGGAIASGSGGAGFVTVSGSTFTGNAAYDGGAIENGLGGSGSVTVTDSSFRGNFAWIRGGAISNHAGSVRVMDSTFTRNGPGSMWGEGGRSPTTPAAATSGGSSCRRPRSPATGPPRTARRSTTPTTADAGR
ncbi:MAG TPA: hypothetical protein VGH27_06705 [Streptosporangiaceae bacterium]|jgi:hypothetical protein